ncbi:response regulator [Stenotrophomonas sp. PD6]|uniref:response regulator n=1 Tax=Stenotrophomonas sp. PD6 TaxID=3368612 RepID=UPI003BA1F851
MDTTHAQDLQDLRDTQAWFRSIIESAPDGLLVADADGVILLANEQVEHLFGYPREALIGQKVEMLLPLQHRDGHVQLREAFVAEGGTRPMAMGNRELHGRHQSGALFPVEVALSTLPAIGRRGATICATVRDVSLRNEAERQVAAHRLRLMALFDALPVGAMLFDARGRVVEANDVALRLTGTSMEGLRTRDLLGWQVVHADLTPMKPTDYPASIALRTGKATHAIEMGIPGPSGGLTWLSASAIPIGVRASGGVAVAFENITERKRSEQELRRINFLSDVAMQLTDSAYWHIDFTDAEKYYASPRAAEIFGEVLREDGRYDLQREWLDRVVAADPAAAASVSERFLGAIEGRYAHYEATYPYRRPNDGATIWLRSAGRLVRDETTQAPRYMYGVNQDISGHKATEHALEKATAAALEATQAKSDFLANMSHEIRTPMNAIIGMSHLALQTELTSRQRGYLEKVNRAADHLLQIINDILDFSKIEAGKLALEQTEFRLEDVFDQLANLLGVGAEGKGLELLFQIPDAAPGTLVGDPLRLAQVLINLGNNALKFTHEGEVVIGVETLAGNEHATTLHFWVRDSGIGMDPEQCSRLFQSFIQADASTTRKYGGTGLGLVISKSLVEAMGGRIWVESAVGAGSTFHFEAQFGVREGAYSRRMFRADELVGVRVLVVDDNAAAREILSSMARSFGLEVDLEVDGAHALRAIDQACDASAPYDLVLMDWKMPGMDGMQTMQKAQAQHGPRSPAVIMVTAYGREDALSDARARDVSLSALLTKPVTPSTLLEAVGSALDLGTLVETRASERAVAHADAFAQLTGLRVLLVEDNELNQELAMELLTQAGMEVVLAENGQQAVDLLARDAHFDGVLMDCQMPVMDGYTATREIRRTLGLVDLPILAMTANAMSGDREKVMAAGMNDHIAKPLQIGPMFATIAKWLCASAAATAPTAARKAEVHVDTTPVDLEGLPGIDAQAGLAGTMGNLSLYRRLLGSFSRGNLDFASAFRRSWPADPPLGMRMAHTLKGTAGTIGADAVRRAAAELERACADAEAHADMEPLIAAVEHELRVVLEGLQAFAGEPAESAGVAVGSALQASLPRAELERLKTLLAQSDADALPLMADLAELARGTQWQAVFDAARHDLDAFLFEEALEKLAGLTQ